MSSIKTETLIGVIDTKNPNILAEVSTGPTVVANIIGVGPQGPQGDRGLSAYDIWISQGNHGTVEDFLSTITGELSTFVYEQIASSNIWNVTHPLDKYPAVTVVDTGGNIVVGEVFYISTSLLTITFSSEFSGKAYLN